MSLAIWDTQFGPDPALTSARHAGTWFTYLGGMEGWVDLHIEKVHPPTHGNTSKY